MSIHPIIYALLAFGSWGLFPIYWHQIHTVHSYDLINLRIIISLLTLLLVLLLRKNFTIYLRELKNRKTMLWSLLTGTLISFNWGLYIYAVTSGHIVESSLGYFMTPILNMILGVLVLKEKLNSWKIVALLMASLGLIIMVSKTGGVPTLSLLLAISFSVYGLTRKKITVPPLVALSLEMSWVFFPALIYLFFFNQTNFQQTTHVEFFYLGFCGMATILPLIWFGHAVKGLPLSTVGLIQYISPSLQFLTGVFLYNEPFSSAKLIAFSFIWIGLLIVSISSLWQHYNLKKITPTDNSPEMLGK